MLNNKEYCTGQVVLFPASRIRQFFLFSPKPNGYRQCACNKQVAATTNINTVDQQE